jgi:hypothetical protein
MPGQHRTVDQVPAGELWKPAFWKDAAERAIRTTAQIMVALILAAGTGLLDTDWLAYLSSAAMAGLLSVLTSVASEMKSPDGTASLVSQPSPPSPAVPPR